MFNFQSLNQTVDAHLPVAKETSEAGNVNLDNIHMDYAKAMQQGV